MSRSSFKGGHLFGDLGGLEIVHALEVQLDRQLGVFVGQLVLHLHGHARRRAGENVIEIVAVDVDHLAILERLERRLGRARQIARTPTTNGSSFFSIAPPVSTS